MASSRKKSNSKVVLILFLTIIVIIFLWYQYFYTPTTKNIETLKVDIETTQGQLDLLNIKLAKQNQMLQDIEYLKTINTAVPAYNNYKALATVLDVILAQVTDFTVAFQEPTMTKSANVSNVNTARRIINISFEAETYDIAKKLIADIHDVPFRLQVSSTSIAMTGSNVYHAEEDFENKLGNSPVKVSITVTFFENEYL